MELPEDDELLAVARLKDRTDLRMAGKIAVARLVWWICGTLGACIISVTLWVAKVQFEISDLHRDRGAIEILWEKVFNYKLPP
jgi:hypothetical protein